MSLMNLNLLLGTYNLSSLYARERLNSCPAQRANVNDDSDETSAVTNAQNSESLSINKEDSSLAITPASLIGNANLENLDNKLQDNLDNSHTLDNSPKSVEDRFEEALKNLKPTNELTASLTAERLKAAALELGGSVGQAEANRFMNKILTAAATTPSSDDGAVEMAIDSFFTELSGASTENPSIYQKLEDIKKTLNQSSSPSSDSSSTAKVSQNYQPLTESQISLYSGYVAAKNPSLNAGALLARPLGNLVNSFI
ncbi:MAG: hypothetical protein LBE31_04895 [Deltaproteobacteria bacterium]|jgi:hypothetical protein|nr:hypothetical protein [Deltaproteobacteria bacterium]